MLKRIILLAALLLLALAFSCPAAAQPNWSLVLFDSVSQGLLRVSLDGTHTPIDLGLPAGSIINQQSVDFSADASHVAYCATTNQTDGAHAALYAREVSGSAPLFNADLGKSDGCWIKYSRDGSQIAAGVVHHYAGDPNADPNVPAWELLVFDAISGQQLHEMNPTKQPASLDATRTIMPEVRYFAGDLIVFAGLAWGTEGSPVSPAYLWQTSSDALQPVDRWWRSGWDTLAFTGELTWVELNPDLPAAEPGGPVPQANVVHLASDSGDEISIYKESDWVILDTKFIDDGRQLAINELQGYSAGSDPGSQLNRWIALNRDGTVTQLATTLGFSQVVSAPDGYAIFQASDNSATPVLTLEYHTGRETTTLWQQQASGGVSWSILWSQPVSTDASLRPFQAITTQS
jgi:hypothetical protein